MKKLIIVLMLLLFCGCEEPEEPVIIGWDMQSPANSQDITINECVFEVTEPNLIVCDCCFDDFVKVLYRLMTNTDSNDVVLRFASKDMKIGISGE
jgi:hypothetical protein